MSIVKCHSTDSKCLESTSSHLLTKYRCRSIGGKEVQCKFALAIQHRFPFSRILRERVSHFEDSLVHEGGGGGGRGGGGGGGGMERHRRNYRGRDTIPLSRGWVPPRAREHRRTGYDVCFSPREVTMPFSSSSSPLLEITYYTPVY